VNHCCLWHNYALFKTNTKTTPEHMFAHIKEDISIVFERDPAARTHWEILTTYPGVHALLMHRLSHWFWKANFFWLGRFCSHIGRWFTGIEIH
ncbi:serine O-acetyltransferase, partial [Klebsiella pneumoniae]|uniref:serine O-acetyltransferase n=1 Tax=Klebsiella pneumoniae TaxID=573 RepID=UPI00397092F8